MLVSRQKVFLLLLFAGIGCSETTAPNLPATFALVNINGRPIPTYFSVTPGLTSTVLSAYLTLQTDGHAFWIENRRDDAGAFTSFSHNFEYRINNGQIEVGSFQPCAPNANCVGTYKGSVSNDALSLVIVELSTDGSITYNYRTTVGIPVD
jgi:hypothetical protein